MDRLDLFEKDAELLNHYGNPILSVKIQKTFELSTAQFIHKPLEQVSKWSVYQNIPSLLIFGNQKTFKVFDDSIILCSKPMIAGDGFTLNITSLNILHDQQSWCHEIYFPIFKNQLIAEYRVVNDDPQSTAHRFSTSIYVIP